MVGGPASVYHQDMDPNNSVVRLCVQGMECEGRGRFEDAAQLFLSAWNESTDDFERCIAAHYVARHRKNPVDTLMWNQRSLDLADAVADDRVREFYPSLYLNMGRPTKTLETVRLRSDSMRSISAAATCRVKSRTNSQASLKCMRIPTEP